MAQTLLKEDMKNGLHKQWKKKDLWMSRPDYFEQFPLKVFRDKIHQEQRTAKYLHTLRVFGTYRPSQSKEAGNQQSDNSNT